MTCLLEHEDVILTLFELVNVNSLLLSSLANRPTIEGKKAIYQGAVSIDVIHCGRDRNSWRIFYYSMHILI